MKTRVSMKTSAVLIALVFLASGCFMTRNTAQHIPCPEADAIQTQIDALSDSESIETESDLKNLVSHSGRLASLQAELKEAREQCRLRHQWEEADPETGDEEETNSTG